MTDSSEMLALVEQSTKRRERRRHFLKLAGGAAATAGAMTLLSGCDDDDDDSPTPTPTPAPTPAPSPTPSPSPTPTPSASVSQADALNFALNLEYLEASFYLKAAFGQVLPNSLSTGVGSVGTVVGGRQVRFTDPIVAQYAREIALDEQHHVEFLRTALGSAAVARPRLNIAGTGDGAFTAAARAAGVIGNDEVFDPYANDENFLLAAFLFEDVGVTAYKGALQFLTDAGVIEAAAGIHAVEAYHAGLVRTVLYRKGIDMPSLITASTKISAARDSLDGPDNLDQPIVVNGEANLVPADGNAIAFQRTPRQVLNIVYLNNAAVNAGGFFPEGTAGLINTSSNNGSNT